MGANEQKIEELHRQLQQHLYACPFKSAGRLIYYDMEQAAFILGIHTPEPEDVQKGADIFWNSLPSSLKEVLKAVNIGFAGKKI